MVGGAEEYDESILKDLSKGPKAKTKEQELAEEWANFNEDNLGVEPKRPGREGARHPRGHEPKPRYKTVKADEAANPAQQAAIAIAMKKAGKKPKQVDESDEGISEDSLMDMIYDILSERPRLGDNAVIKLCKQYVEEDGDTFTNDDIVRIKQLLPSVRQDIRQSNLGEAYKTANPHPASKDPIVAKVVKQMRPGLTGLDMGNEAFLYFAYELGKQRARDAWSDYLPAIRAAYEHGLNESADLKKQADKYTELASKANKLGDDEKCKAFQKKVADIKKKMAKLNEGWESGPEEYEEPYDDADDAYDRQRQEKIDTEAEKEWAKLPKVSTYKLIGRGPDMEPNHEFGPEFDSLEQALEYRAEIMKDPKTPHPEHIGIQTLTRVKENSVTPLRDREDLQAKRKNLQDLQTDRNAAHPEMQRAIIDRKNALDKQAKAKGFEESRGHTIIANKLKDIERAKKFAKGELEIPTPQERQAQLKKLEKKPKTAEDLQPMDNPQATGMSMLPTQADANDPAAKKQVQNVLQATQKLNAATGSKAASPEKTDQALDKILQGKPIDASEIKTVQPLLKGIAPAAQNPQNASKLVGLINQLKSGS